MELDLKLLLSWVLNAVALMVVAYLLPGVLVDGFLSALWAALILGLVNRAQSTRDLLPCEGVVVKVGVGRMCATGALTQSPVHVGDRIKFKDYAGNDIMIEGKKYSVVKMVDILATYVGEKK